MSNSERVAIAAISLASGITRFLQRYYEQKTGCWDIKRLVEKLNVACHEALRTYDGSLSSKDVRAMTLKIKQVEEQLYGANQTHGPVVALSLAMGLVNDVYDQTRNPKRRDSLNHLLDRLLLTMKYYDRKMNRTTDYEIAMEGIAVWQREIGAA